jgi:phosphoglucomutase
MTHAEDVPVKVSPQAGKLTLVDLPRLVTAYCTGMPDVSEPEQRVVFGTSVHGGSSFADKVDEWHVLAIGIGTHALSVTAGTSVLDHFAARPSGTEDIHKTHAESICGADHLQRMRQEARAIVSGALASPSQKSGTASNTPWNKNP